MKEAIQHPAYWKERLRVAQHTQNLHHAVFLCGKYRWEQIESAHQLILRSIILDDESILDAGCAWGRLLELLPPSWQGRYLGVDICRDFLELGREKHPGKEFVEASLTRLPLPSQEFDWAILISIRPMIIRNLGQEVWDRMEKELKRVAKHLLFLEYDPNDPGEIL